MDTSTSVIRRHGKTLSLSSARQAQRSRLLQSKKASLVSLESVLKGESSLLSILPPGFDDPTHPTPAVKSRWLPSKDPTFRGNGRYENHPSWRSGNDRI